MDERPNNTEYTPRNIRLSHQDSARWDGANASERRRLIAEVTDAVLTEQSDSHGCAVRVHHADGQLLAKTVLHKPLFAGAG